jgi:chromosome segregation ATPase
VDEFERRYDKWRNDEEAIRRDAKAEIEKMKKAHAESLTVTGRELTTCKTKIASLRAELAVAQNDVGALHNRIATYKGELQYWDSFTLGFRQLEIGPL